MRANLVVVFCFFFLNWIPRSLREFHKVGLKYLSDFGPNHNYNKILKSDWFSTALISALIGQFNRTVRVMPK